MTKINWDNFPAIPGFDCVKWKWERQAQILQETEGMTDEEVCSYFRQASDRAVLRRQAAAEQLAANMPQLHSVEQ